MGNRLGVDTPAPTELLPGWIQIPLEAEQLQRQQIKVVGIKPGDHGLVKVPGKLGQIRKHAVFI